MAFEIQDDDVKVIVRLVDRLGIRTVLEFGPGHSTSVFLALGCEVDSVESDNDRLMKMIHGFHGKKANIHPCSDGYPVKSPAFSVSKRWDLAFVDGPWGEEPGKFMPRLNSCLACFRRAPLILLHDTKRQNELRIIAVMLDIGCTIIDAFNTEKGMVLLKTLL